MGIILLKGWQFSIFHQFRCKGKISCLSTKISMQPALAAITVKLIVFEEQFNSDGGLIYQIDLRVYLRID